MNPAREQVPAATAEAGFVGASNLIIHVNCIRITTTHSPQFPPSFIGEWNSHLFWRFIIIIIIVNGF